MSKDMECINLDYKDRYEHEHERVGVLEYLLDENMKEREEYKKQVDYLNGEIEKFKGVYASIQGDNEALTEMCMELQKKNDELEETLGYRKEARKERIEMCQDILNKIIHAKEYKFTIGDIGTIFEAIEELRDRLLIEEYDMNAEVIY